LQTGVVPPQSALPLHPTQAPVPTLQTAVCPPHLLTLLAEQTPQAPLGWQAGVAPPQSPSPAQPRQLCVAVLQTGVAPPQSVFVKQPTQVPLAGEQTAVVPPQAVVLVAEHWPQAPLPWQAGVAPPH